MGSVSTLSHFIYLYLNQLPPVLSFFSCVHIKIDFSKNNISYHFKYKSKSWLLSLYVEIISDTQLGH